MMKKFLFLSFLLLRFFNPAYCQASLIINELFPYPQVNSEEKEWLEIYNPQNLAVKIHEYKIVDAKNNIRFLTKDKEASIEAKEFFILETGNIMDNSGDTIYLYDNQQNLIDSITYPGNLMGKSYARKNDGETKWQVCDLPTKAKSNYFCQERAELTEEEKLIQLQALEFYPCPQTGEKEWLYLKNLSSFAVNMRGFKLQNQNGTSRTLTDLVLPSNAGKRIEFASGLAPNTGGKVFLLDTDGETQIEIDYPACQNKGALMVESLGKWHELIDSPNEKTILEEKIKKPVSISEETETEKEDKKETKIDLAIKNNQSQWQKNKLFSLPKTNYQSMEKVVVSSMMETDWETSPAAKLQTKSLLPEKLLFGSLAIIVIIGGLVILLDYSWQNYLASKNEKSQEEFLVDY